MNIYGALDFIYYRDWITLFGYIDLYEYKYPRVTCDYVMSFSTSTSKYEIDIFTDDTFVLKFISTAYGEVYYSTQNLFGNLIVSSLTNNIN